MASVIVVNGKRIEVNGNDVSIKNGEVFVDGKKVSEKATSELSIKIEGTIQNLTIDNGDVEVKGAILGDVDCGGSVKAETITGSIDCGGSVQCGNVGGSIDCGGSVQCGDIKGDVDAGGSVNMRKN